MLQTAPAALLAVGKANHGELWPFIRLHGPDPLKIPSDQNFNQNRFEPGPGRLQLEIRTLSVFQRCGRKPNHPVDFIGKSAETFHK